MTVHVVPVADIIEHETEGLDCVCGPDVEYVDPDDGSTYPSGPLVTHHSLDGREYRENTERPEGRPCRERPPGGGACHGPASGGLTHWNEIADLAGAVLRDAEVTLRPLGRTAGRVPLIGRQRASRQTISNPPREPAGNRRLGNLLEVARKVRATLAVVTHLLPPCSGTVTTTLSLFSRVIASPNAPVLPRLSDGREDT